jgi:hypothetical protein
MIALKALLAGVGLSTFGTFVYLVLYFWWISRLARLANPGGTTETAVGWDLISMAHNTICAPAYWLFVLGLFATGSAIVFLWPGPVLTP